jgi:hypothetical protein
MDECLQGIENDNTQHLQDYKSALKDKFFIYDADDFLLGGLCITLGFLNKPEIIYQTVVYSYVDEETETIIGYELRGFMETKEKADFTKEEILIIMKEHPEYKFW